MNDLSETYFEGIMRGALYGLSLTDFAVPLGYLVWASIFFVSLKKVDCRDYLAGFMYATYCSMSGVILVEIIPSAFHQISDFKTYCVQTVSFFAISSFFWLRQMIAQHAKVEHKKKES